MHKFVPAIIGAFLMVWPSVGFTAVEKPAALRKAHVPRMSYIGNESIRLGVDLNLGGAITYLAPATNHELNVINSHDWGRQVQLSYYSGPVPFNPPGTMMSTNWHFIGWNPIQTGDAYGFKSQVLQHTNTGRTLYTRLIPMHWPLKNVPGECECEGWRELDGPAVKARCRVTNLRPDHTPYRARGQELPAVYVNAPFHRLMTYRGDKPFTGDALTKIDAQLVNNHWAHWTATENWAAEVNDAGWGLGVWNPDAFAFSGGFAGRPGVGGPLDSPTGYIAPNRLEILDHNIVYDYHYELILGTVEEIRSRVYRRAARPAPLAYEFTHDRQGWHYGDASDQGWPVRGELDVRSAGKDPHIVSPEFFIRADDAPQLTVEAAFSTGRSNVMVMWRKLDPDKEQGFVPTLAHSFPVIPDGQFRRYQFNLGASPEYRGIITQLRLYALPASNPTAHMRLKSVTLGPVAFQEGTK
ncbi:MAG: hypothetical protein NTZ16_06585 [Verrucomicrobia bacterium]|nr:hypothetical protein [Verrucomicrobiota bacterium]